MINTNSLFQETSLDDSVELQQSLNSTTTTESHLHDDSKLLQTESDIPLQNIESVDTTATTLICIEDNNVSLLPMSMDDNPALKCSDNNFIQENHTSLTTFDTNDDDETTASTETTSQTSTLSSFYGPRLQSITSATVTPEILTASTQDIRETRRRRRTKALQNNTTLLDNHIDIKTKCDIQISEENTSSLLLTDQDVSNFNSGQHKQSNVSKKRRITRKQKSIISSSNNDETSSETQMLVLSEAVDTKPLLKNKRSLSKKKTMQHDNSDKPYTEMTLWEIILKNKRIVTKEELETRKRAKEEAEKKNNDNNSLKNDDSLAFLLSGSESLDINNVNDFFETPSTNQKTVDLFESSDLFALGRYSSEGASLRLDEDGNLLLEDSSSKTESATHEGLFDLLEGRTLIDEDFSIQQNIQPFAGAYKYTKPTQWSEKDEKQFFRAVETFGIDFMMIRTMLPQFTIKQIRDKFKREERRSSEKVEAALKRRRPLSIANFETLNGPIDISTHFRPDDEDDNIALTYIKQPALPPLTTKTDDSLAIIKDDMFENLLNGSTTNELLDNDVHESFTELFDTSSTYPFEEESKNQAHKTLASLLGI